MDRFAPELDCAIAELPGRTRLMVDRRGNLGGFVGSLRLMSYYAGSNPRWGTWSLYFETSHSSVSPSRILSVRFGHSSFQSGVPPGSAPSTNVYASAGCATLIAL